MIKIAALLFVVAACAPSVSFAEDEAAHGACKADREKFCKDVEPGEGRIVKCMKEHEADLSAECKTKMAEGKKKWEQGKADFDKACGGDVKSLCGDVKPGKGAVMKCLKQNKEKVSEGCKTFMKEKHEQRKERREKRMGKAGKGDEKEDTDKGE